MFSKTALIKFAFLPLAAVALLAPVASASPWASAALQERQDDGPSSDKYYWPPPPNTDCEPNRTSLPRITLPNSNTVWRVGEWERVRWQFQRGGSALNDTVDVDVDVDAVEVADLEAGVEEASADSLDPRRPWCTPKLVLYKRREQFFRPITISDSFDLNQGFADIFVPSVRPDDDYVVILYLGRMQSRGDMFQIMRRRN